MPQHLGYIDYTIMIIGAFAALLFIWLIYVNVHARAKFVRRFVLVRYLLAGGGLLCINLPSDYVLYVHGLAPRYELHYGFWLAGAAVALGVIVQIADLLHRMRSKVEAVPAAYKRSGYTGSPLPENPRVYDQDETLALRN